jgi:hypothetical protein
LHAMTFSNNGVKFIAGLDNRRLVPHGPSSSSTSREQVGRLAPIQPSSGELILSQSASASLALSIGQLLGAKLGWN